MHLMDLQIFRSKNSIHPCSIQEQALNCREYALTTERNYMIAKLIFTVAAVVGAVFVVSALLVAPELVGIAAIIFGVSALIDLFVCTLEHYSDVKTHNETAKNLFNMLSDPTT